MEHIKSTYHQIPASFPKVSRPNSGIHLLTKHMLHVNKCPGRRREEQRRQDRNNQHDAYKLNQGHASNAPALEMNNHTGE